MKEKNIDDLGFREGIATHRPRQRSLVAAVCMRKPVRRGETIVTLDSHDMF